MILIQFYIKLHRNPYFNAYLNASWIDALSSLPRHLLIPVCATPTIARQAVSRSFAVAPSSVIMADASAPSVTDSIQLGGFQLPGFDNTSPAATSAAPSTGIEPDNSTDDEGYAASTTTSYVTSLASDIRRGVEENGRVYAAYGIHKPWMPVDEQEVCKAISAGKLTSGPRSPNGISWC